MLGEHLYRFNKSLFVISFINRDLYLHDLCQYRIIHLNATFIDNSTARGS